MFIISFKKIITYFAKRITYFKRITGDIEERIFSDRKEEKLKRGTIVII